MITYKKINIRTLSRWMFEFHGHYCPFMPIGIGHPQGYKQASKKASIPCSEREGEAVIHPPTINRPLVNYPN